MAKKSAKRQAAIELTRDRMKLKEIMENHDVREFREFIERNSIDGFEEFDDEKLSDYMHTHKATQPHYANHFIQSRNYLRMKKYWNDPSQFPEWAKDEIPLCHSCKYFRESPGNDESPCMHLGATPTDVCCPGFKPIKQ